MRGSHVRKKDILKMKCFFKAKIGFWRILAKEIGISYWWIVNFMRPNHKPNPTSNTLDKIRDHIEKEKDK